MSLFVCLVVGFISFCLFVCMSLRLRGCSFVVVVVVVMVAVGGCVCGGACGGCACVGGGGGGAGDDATGAGDFCHNFCRT